jgi:hypothetical protein
MEEYMKIGDFSLINAEKVDRALNGAMSEKGQLKGGVKNPPIGKDGKPIYDWKALTKEEQGKLLLAHYDKLGGLIRKGELKVRMGSFYDFLKRQPKEKPEVVFEAMSEDGIMDLNEDEAKALKKVEKKKKALKDKKLKKKKLKK